MTKTRKYSNECARSGAADLSILTWWFGSSCSLSFFFTCVKIIIFEHYVTRERRHFCLFAALCRFIVLITSQTDFMLFITSRSMRRRVQCTAMSLNIYTPAKILLKEPLIKLRRHSFKKLMRSQKWQKNILTLEFMMDSKSRNHPQTYFILTFFRSYFKRILFNQPSYRISN